MTCARAANPDTPLTIVQVASLGTIGDNIPSSDIPTDVLPPLARAAAVRLLSMPCRPTLGPSHHRLDLVHPAEHRCAAGVAALQTNDTAQACAAFSNAVRLDPSDATAYSRLGHCLLRQGSIGLARHARQALQRAMALDPLLSRPVRTLARLHRTRAQHYTQSAAQIIPLRERIGATMYSYYPFVHHSEWIDIHTPTYWSASPCPTTPPPVAPCCPHPFSPHR